jgi:hypothetical protein
MSRALVTVLPALAIWLGAAPAVAAMTGTNHAISVDTVSAGVGDMSSTGYRLRSTVGGFAIGGGASAGYQQHAGFQGSLAKVAVGTLTVAKDGAGSGTVVSAPAGIDCGASCAADFALGSSVTLTATPAAGSTFASWTGCDSVAGNECTVSVGGARAVTASFAGAPAMGVLPGVVAFTPRQVGTMSAEQVITVSNTGTAPLSVSISGMNTIEFPYGGTCVTPPPAPIPAGGSCTVTVRFAPQATGTRNGTVVVTGDDPLNPTVNVALSGTGIDEIPDAFSFAAATGVAPGAEVTSAAATITGISPSAPVTVTGGSYSIGCTGTFTSAGGTITNGQTVCVRHQASASYAAQVTTTLTIGGVSADFTSTTVAAPVVATRGDANGDGKADLFWRTAAPGQGLSWWAMNGAVATAANYHDVDAAWQIADVGDLDGDGKADLVWRRTVDGASYLWLLDGFAFKGFADLGVLDPAAWSLVGAADLDGDGKDDIVWRGVDGTVYAWLMNGGVIASQGVISNPGAAWVIADLADMDGDGKADIVFRNVNDGGVYISFMNGLSIASGGFVGAVDPATWTLVGAADFSGDGKADFLWRHTSGDTWVWLMNGANFMSAGGIGNPGAGWSVRSFGDFDGDGKSDLVWRHTDGTTYLWRMNGLSVSAFDPVANPGGSWEVVAP